MTVISPESIVLVPISISPNPDVMLPLSSAPTVVREEVTTPEPNVSELRTEVLAILNSLPEAALTCSLRSQLVVAVV